MKHTDELLDAYRDLFSVHVEVDDDPERMSNVYELRYQVYCIENLYEDATEFPDGRESDAFDERAVHSLLVHRASGLAAGTVRMVFPDPGSPDKPVPLDAVCSDPGLKTDTLIPRAGLAEISRFAISKRFRRRRLPRWTAALEEEGGIEGDDAVHGGTAQSRVIPHMSLGLIEALVANSARYGVTHWCAAMEPSLLRMLGTLGIHFQPLGPVVRYQGLRQPCYTDVEAMLQRVYLERPDIWELITNHGDHWPGSFPRTGGLPPG